MTLMTTLKFGKEVRQDFEIHESCFDCADFYDGCTGWRNSKEFDCRGYYRLPNVGIDGNLRQEFPPSRRQLPVHLVPESREQHPADDVHTRHRPHATILPLSAEEPAQVMKISHVAVQARDIEQSVAFYCNFLGFVESSRLRYPDDGSLMLVNFKVSDDQWIELFNAAKLIPGCDPLYQIAFRVAGASCGAGLSSMSFWWRRCMVQSRSQRWTTLPWVSARIWTSTWRGCSTYFSR